MKKVTSLIKESEEVQSQLEDTYGKMTKTTELLQEEIKFLEWELDAKLRHKKEDEEKTLLSAAVGGGTGAAALGVTVATAGATAGLIAGTSTLSKIIEMGSWVQCVPVSQYIWHPRSIYPRIFCTPVGYLAFLMS